MTRRLLAIQMCLGRAARNIWSIFERTGWVELDRLADGGTLVMNPGMFDVLNAEDEPMET